MGVAVGALAEVAGAIAACTSRAVECGDRITQAGIRVFERLWGWLLAGDLQSRTGASCGRAQSGGGS